VSEEREALHLLGQTLEKVTAVNGFFITAGYAVFFGVWGVMKDDLSRGYFVASFVWLLVSAAIFVLWHMLGLAMMNLAVLRIAGAPPSKVRDRIFESTTDFIRRYALGWLAVVAATWIIGVGILISGLIDWLIRV
jgi:hypothetical protein